MQRKAEARQPKPEARFYSFARNMLIKVLLVARLGRLTRLLGHRSDDWPY